MVHLFVPFRPAPDQSKPARDGLVFCEWALSADVLPVRCVAALLLARLLIAGLWDVIGLYGAGLAGVGFGIALCAVVV